MNKSKQEQKGAGGTGNLVVVDRLKELIEEMNTNSIANSTDRTSQPQLPPEEVPPAPSTGQFKAAVPESTLCPLRSQVPGKKDCDLKCHGCQKLVADGTHVQVMVQKEASHQECLRCVQCRKSLGASEYFIREGKVYCPTNFLILLGLGSRCKGCQKKVSEYFTIVKEELWHLKCYVCSICGKGIGIEDKDPRFYGHNGKIFCERDYFLVIGRLCEGCKKPIKERCLNVGTGKWHPDCLICMKCRKPMGGRKCYQNEDTKLTICEECNKALPSVE